MSDYKSESLPFDEYSKYEIPQEYEAFKITFSKVSPDRVDDLEQEMILKGNKLYHSDIQTSFDGTYELTLIVARLSGLVV